jgi:hypothetical protein
VHANYAVALTQIPGRRSDAIAQYEAALRLKPDATAIRDSLEKLRAQQPPGPFRNGR